jgi:hypothetical protein
MADPKETDRRVDLVALKAFADIDLTPILESLADIARLIGRENVTLSYFMEPRNKIDMTEPALMRYLPSQVPVASLQGIETLKGLPISRGFRVTIDHDSRLVFGQGSHDGIYTQRDPLDIGQVLVNKVITWI